MYIDLDRLLHWLANYPDEFWETASKCFETEFLHIGRNRPAFLSHPRTQQETEKIVNELSRQLLGFSGSYDCVSANWAFSIRLASKLLELKTHTSTGFYATWPIFLWHWAETKQYIEVDGQEWETPDRFRSEIEAQGYDAWLAQYQSSTEWDRRVTLLNECLKELSMIGTYALRHPHVLD